MYGVKGDKAPAVSEQGFIPVPSKKPKLTKENFAAKSRGGSIPGVMMALRDAAAFHQQDPRWGDHTLGGSGEAMHSDGCLVTATAMAMSNLGFQTDPGDLVSRLKGADGFTRQGWMVWSGLEKVTGGMARTRFFKSANEDDVRACLADGFYPLVKFKLPSRRSHWAVVVAEGKTDFYVRDPMISSATPIPLRSRAQGIDSVRCIGMNAAAL